MEILSDEEEKLRSPSDIARDVEITSISYVTNPNETTIKSDIRWRMILEPVLAGTVLGSNLAHTSLHNFYLRTACMQDLNYSMEVCNSGVGEGFQIAEEESQKVVSSINVSRSFVAALISTTILLFLGPWSDCSGRRKPLIVLPLIGMISMTSIVLIFLIFPGASTMLTLYILLIPVTLGGGYPLMQTAVYSYIGDVCNATGRDVSRSMVTHRAATQIAQVIGSIGGPLIFRYIGFYGVFSIVLSLQLLSLAYVLVVMDDVEVKNDNKVSVFNWRLPCNAVSCLLRPREGHARKIIAIMLVISLADKVIMGSHTLIGYMYFRRKFQWNDIWYGSYLSFKDVVSFCGTLLILSVLKQSLGLCDENIGAISCVSYILSAVGLIATSNSIVVFALQLVGILSQGSIVVQRPILNKQILPLEQGKIYSLMGALQAATQMAASPAYYFLYFRTVSSAIDAWLLPAIMLASLEIGFYLWSRKLGK